MKQQPKILYILHERPYPDNPSFEIYLIYRLKILTENIDDVFVIYLAERHGFWYSLLRRMAKGLKDNDSPLQITINDITRFGIPYTLNLYDLFLKNIAPNHYLKHLGNKITYAIQQKLGSRQYDLIHCHSPFPNGYIGKILKEKNNTPLIITCHGSDIHTHPIHNSIIKKYTVATLSSADAVIFVSDSLRQTAQNLGYDGENAVVIPNGVDTKKFTILDKELHKNRLGLSGMVVGFVGNLELVKRADKFLDIFRKIKKSTNDIEFLVIGDGKEWQTLVDGCKKEGFSAKFVGYMEPNKMPELYNAMDLLILPSRNEGWPCVLEAQACGVPVVGSDNGGIPEAVGDGGAIVPDGAEFESRFSAAVLDALNRPWDRESLRQRAMKYDWSNTVDREIEIYNKIITQKKSRGI
jgi:teichuronic acid biosynthesis glycosyltransferase TuaC